VIPERSECSWRPDELPHGLEGLLSLAGHALGPSGLPPLVADSEPALFRWMADAPRMIGVEGVIERARLGELLAKLLVPGTYAIFIPSPGGGVVLLVLSEGARSRVLSRSGGELRVSAGELVELASAIAADPDDDDELAALFADLPGGRRIHQRLRRDEQLEKQAIVVVGYHRDGASPIATQVRARGGLGLLITFLVVYALQLAITAGSAYALGSAAVDGLVERGRVAAWALVTLANVPLAYWSTVAVGRLSLLASLAIKRRLLEGSFFVSEDVLRKEGYGETLARLNEAGVVERSSVTEIVSFLTPLASVIVAAVLFARGSHAVSFLTLLLVTVTATVVLAVRDARAYDRTYASRLALSEDVIEKIVGHRTRAVQQHPSVLHGDEDRRLVDYERVLAKADVLSALLTTTSRLWIVLAGGVLAFGFALGDPQEELLLSGVAIFLVSTALSASSNAVARFLAWWSASHAIAPLFAAGRERERPRREIGIGDAEAGLPTVLNASALSFSYRAGGRPIFTNANVRIFRGERVLFAGPSGGGKTTLAKLIAGELRPQGGTLLVSSLDPMMTSESQWRELVASAPQFHENFVFSQTFSFNVDPMQGRLRLTREASEICAELGLGELLAKMPSGPAQLLGETGWQLSHGERSRIFIARTLLQKAPLLIFDESFAALDPETLQLAIQCVRKRAQTLILIAHV
jgi:ATP-binding cassette subfamily B protein